MLSVSPRFPIEGFLYHLEGTGGRERSGGRGLETLIDAFSNIFVKTIWKNLVDVSIHVPRE